MCAHLKITENVNMLMFMQEKVIMCIVYAKSPLGVNE